LFFFYRRPLFCHSVPGSLSPVTRLLTPTRRAYSDVSSSLTCRNPALTWSVFLISLFFFFDSVLYPEVLLVAPLDIQVGQKPLQQLLSFALFLTRPPCPPSLSRLDFSDTFFLFFPFRLNFILFPVSLIASPFLCFFYGVLLPSEFFFYIRPLSPTCRSPFALMGVARRACPGKQSWTFFYSVWSFLLSADYFCFYQHCANAAPFNVLCGVLGVRLFFLIPKTP